jgi:DNA helicase-2/ATP-dependent DNA helicase PcrA
MKLTDSQIEAVECPARLFQIVACAGSGKTEVLARRVVRRLLEGVPAGGIVAFTFTEKAAAELKSRIEQRAAEEDSRFASLPPGSSGLFVGTIHSFCLSYLQQVGGAYELFDPMAEEREWALLHRFGRRLGLVDLMEQRWPGEPVSVRRAVELFARSLAVVHNERLDRQELSARAPQFAATVERYEGLLRDMQLLSFDQMIEMAVRELGEGGRIRAMVEGRLREVFVDEYQDLNRAQERLLQLLVETGAHLTVVGDDDQAIYQWRGGDVSGFVGFCTRFAPAERRTLGLNHRSVRPIVEVSGRFATTIAPRLEKDIQAAREDAGPAVELAAASIPQGEAELIAGRIQRLLGEGHRPGDIGVLFRSVRSSARPLLLALREKSIPVAVVGRLSLLDRPEMALVARLFVLWGGGTWMPDEEREVVTVEGLVADLQELTGVSGAEAVRALTELESLGGRLRAEGIPDLVGLFMEMIRRLGLPAAGEQRTRQERSLGQLSSLLAEFEHAQRRAAPSHWFALTVERCAEEVAEDGAVLGAAAGAGTSGDAAAVGAAGGPSGAAGGVTPGREAPRLGCTPGQVYLARLRVFLEQFASSAVEESPERPTLDADAVNIMTIHQSKGLEFPIVFVPSLVDRRFPSSRMGRQQRWYLPEEWFDRSRYEGREEDERRLFYVAMTRAREMLVLSWFEGYAHGSEAKRSRLISDVANVAPREHLHLEGCCRPAAGRKAPARAPMLETTFSELDTFCECPRKYYLRHVCSFRPCLVPELGFGKLLHHVLAELARRSLGGREMSASDAEEILAEADYLPFAGPVPRERLLKAARSRLLGYLQRYGKELQRTLAPERRFEVPLESARIYGQIDLVLRAEGGGDQDVELIDFKTAGDRPPSEHHQNQLRLYAEAARVLGMNPVRLAIHDLDVKGGGRIPVPEDPAAAKRFRTQLRGWLRQIAAGQFPPLSRRDSCRACDFVRLCG